MNPREPERGTPKVGAMPAAEMVERVKRHTLFNWAAAGAVEPLPIARAKGVWLYTPEGRRILDWNSQLMSVNIGHSHPKVVEAMKAWLDDGLLYAFPHSAHEPRARLASKLAEIVPGDIDTFYFTLGGAEANENAVRLARLYTGRHKILSRYRSYHGGTNLCMQLTGDPRRWANEPGTPGFVRVLDPHPYRFRFGETDEEITARNLEYLEEVIQYEGPDTIAAMVIETVTGTNGILPPPKGYLKGLRDLLDRYGILLICDEVMCGFGRTGKLFAFEHGDIIPDIVTMAKGLTSSYIPLGAMGMRAHIADHFRDNVYWGGLTYNSHPLSCMTALAVIDVLLEEDMVGNAVRMGAILRQEMDRMQREHPSMREGRCIGLFGMIDIQKNARGEPSAPYNGSSEAMKALARFFREEDLFTFVRWSSFMNNPPLCIREDELRMGLEIVDRALAVTDAYFEG